VVEIMHRLRAPGGCPWDREQTFDSIRKHTLEEAYEVLEAVTARNPAALREELGDLLLQVVFYAEMAREETWFSIADVLRELADKLVRRHPHVFGDDAGTARSADEALARWNAAKAAEKPAAARPSKLSGIAPGLPALAEAHKLGQRAAAAGFDWADARGVEAKLDEEIDELRRARAEGGRQAQEAELGDLLFTLANWARHEGLDPEAALKHANRKFQRRFQAMEAAAGTPELERLSAAQWETLWQRAKQAEKAS
jgi:ATP diphosphatase